MRYSDFIKPDGSIEKLVTQLKEVAETYKRMEATVKSSASSIEEAVKRENGVTKESQERIKKAASETDKLTAAKKKLKASMSENAAQMAKVKAAQAEQNQINKLTEKLNRSQTGSYNKLSAQYSLNKIRLNKMTDAQRTATKVGKQLEKETKLIYEQMNKAQVATGKHTLKVGHYELAADKLTIVLTHLEKRQAHLLQTQGKNSNAYKIVSNEIKKTRSQLESFAATQERTNTIMSRGAQGLKSMLSGFSGVAGASRLFSNVTGTVIDFEAQISSLQAISGASATEIRELSDSAEYLGSNTSKTATEVAELQTEYAKLGFSTNEILAATAATIQLAEATKEDAADAAETAGATVRAFGLEASETQRVVDVMAESFTSSALNMERFGESMKYVAPISRAAGISLETTTAAMSALADAGIHGSAAGTSLRRIIAEFDKSGRPFGEQLELLAEKGLSLADAEDEVGQRAQSALLILANSTDKIDGLSNKYDNASGAAERMAEIQRNNVAGALDLAGSAWDGFVIKMTKGGTVMRTVIDGFAAFFTWATRNARIIKLVGKFILLGATAWTTYKLAVLAATFAKKLNIRTTYANIAAEGLMSTATRVATTAMYQLNAAMNANPIGILITLAMTAASAFALFSDSSETATESMGDFNDVVEENKIDNLIDDLLTLADGNPEEAINNFKDSVKDLSEEDLTAWAERAKKGVRDVNREMNNLDPELLKDESITEEYAKMRKFYTDMTNLVKKEQAKFLKAAGDGTEVSQEDQDKINKLRLDAMADGIKKDLLALKYSHEKKLRAFNKFNLDTTILTEWSEREKAKIIKKYADKAAADAKAKADKAAADAKKAAADAKAKADKAKREHDLEVKDALAVLNQQKDLSLSEIELMKVTEAEKTRLRLKAEQDRLKAILELNKKGLGSLSDLEVGTIKNTIKKLGETMNSAESKDYDLYSLAGLDLSDEKKEAINTSTSFALDQMGQFLNAKIVAAEKATELANKDVDNAEKGVDAEIRAREAGYASNVSGAKKTLELARKNQAKALKDQEKAQKAQLLLDSVVQASSLVTASAKIWATMGFPWAIPALAVMWGSFAFSKVKAAQSTAPAKTYGDGGLEFLEGGSHASGNDIALGTTADGRDRRVEGGETLAIINKRKTGKYKKILPGLISSLNKGTFEQTYLNGAEQTANMQMNVSPHMANLSKIEAGINAIIEQGAKREYTDAKGNQVKIYKNLKTTYV